MKNILILVFFLGFQTSLFADIETKVHILQNSSELFFDVELKNTEHQKVEFELTPEIDLIQSHQIKIIQQIAGPVKIEVAPQTTGILRYKKTIDLAKNYFLYEQNLWHPALVQSLSPRVLNSKFVFTSQLEPDYQFIDSATGRDQSDVAYVFGRYVKYQSMDGRLKVYLITPDISLSQALLKNLEMYLKRYEADIGDYPYDSFSVVESPDEIGYAFPKMTWIGSQLLRFPFILKTSLPHELLHSWWGNGVFVDYSTGNWCEGLTAFGADYAILTNAEKKVYRMKAITNYLNYAYQSITPLSLSQFISRGEDRGLQALGYDKAMMVFVMIEQAVGADTFKVVLKSFFEEFKFKMASYDDFFKVLAKVSGKDFMQFKNYWIDSTGMLAKDFLTIQNKKTNFDLDILFTPKELQKIPSIPLQSEIELSNGQTTVFEFVVQPNGMGLEQSHFVMTESAKSYVVDPDFYLFRELNDQEKMLSFSQFFGVQETYLKVKEFDWKESLKLNFSDKLWIEDFSSFNFSRKQNLIISLEEALQNPQIKNALDEKKISLTNSVLTLEQQTFDLNLDSVFLSLKVNQTAVFIIHLNTQLTTQRWIQRWSRYGGQSYVVLSPQSARTQGVWLEKYRQAL